MAPLTVVVSVLTALAVPMAHPVAAECSPSATGSVDDLFGGDGHFDGADYQRTIELDDGRVLWVFQDVFLDGGGTLVHNAGAIQEGDCFTELTSAGSQPWIAADETVPLHRWYWPLGGYQVDGDTVLLYVAEMHETGAHYLDRTTPVATWQVEIDLVTLEAGELRPAPDPSAELYGWDVVVDDEHTYLFAHCYLQFGFGLIGHDACTTDVTVARQPAGDPGALLRYWDGSGWSSDPAVAANIAPQLAPDGSPRYVNPMQFELVDGHWMAITKEGDWWGDTVYFDVAPAPEGPWTTTAMVPVRPVGDPEETNTYFASFVSTAGPGVTVAVSNNRWDGRFSEEVYRPTERTVPARLWTPREPEPTRAGRWMPIGDPLW